MGTVLALGYVIFIVAAFFVTLFRGSPWAFFWGFMIASVIFGMVKEYNAIQQRNAEEENQEG